MSFLKRIKFLWSFGTEISVVREQLSEARMNALSFRKSAEAKYVDAKNTEASAEMFEQQSVRLAQLLEQQEQQEAVQKAKRSGQVPPVRPPETMSPPAPARPPFD